MEKAGYKVIPIELIIPRKEEYKIMHVDQLMALKTSLVTLGQTRNIHVRQIGDKYEIIEGSKIYSCLKELGKDKVVCYNHTEVNDLQAKKIYFQIDDKNPPHDFILISKMISELAAEYDINKIAQFTGYSITEVKDLIKLKDYNWETFNMEEAIVNQGSLFDSL